MTLALAGYLFSAACYGVSTGYSIRFDARHSVSIAAALAPAVIWLGVEPRSLELSPWIIFAPSVAIATLLARRRGVHEIAGHFVLFAGGVGLAAFGRVAGLDEPLAIGLVTCVVYLTADGLRQRLFEEGRAPVASADRRTYWLLHAVILCACGLTILGVQKMDWPAFAAMAIVLALTKREFEAFSQSRTTYDQTIAAIAELKGRAALSDEL